jgi:hypothetical protein
MFHMIKQAYGEEAFGCSAVFKWHKHFAQGRDSLEDDEHISWPRTVRTELKIQVAMLVHANRSQMVDEITAAAAGISHGTCHEILPDDLIMSRVTQHSAPRVLMQDRRDDHMSTRSEQETKHGVFCMIHN